MTCRISTQSFETLYNITIQYIHKHAGLAEEIAVLCFRLQVKDVEQQLPEKVTITVKCPMSAYQSAVYNW